MKNISNTLKMFNTKLDELKNEDNESLYGPNLKELVIYDKLLEMQKQISGLSDENKVVKDNVSNNKFNG